MIPEEVCHYTKRSYAFKILSTKKLRINQFKNTNDPRESKKRNFPIVHVSNSLEGICEQIESTDAMDKKINRISNRIAANEWKVVCQVIYNSNKFTHVLGLPYPQNNYISIDYIRQHYFAHYKEIFLVKFPDWKYEVEYRWLVHSSSDGPEYVSIGDSIKHVLVGVDYPKAKEPDIVSLCKDLKVPVGKMDWRSGLPIPRFGSIYCP